MSDIMAVLTQEGVDGEFAKLDSLAEALKAKSGTQAQRRRDAGETALGVAISFGEGDDVPESVGYLRDILHTLQNGGEVRLAALATQLQGVNEWAAHVHGEATDHLLKSQGDDTDLAATRKAFDEQKVRCEALLKVAAVIPGMDKLLEGKAIPNARAARGSSGGRSNSSGKRFGTYYRILPSGEKRYQSEQQDKFSSVAWYYGAAIMGKPGEGSANDGKGVPTPELEAYLRANGVDSPQGKPWEIAVNLGDGQVVTFGMEVVGGDKSEEE